MIDLSQYVNKDVIISLKDGTNFRGTVRYSSPVKVHYSIYNSDGVLMFKANSDGSSLYCQDHNIVSVKVNKPEHKQSLDSTTLNTIASALIPEAIKYIESHEKYAEVMQALIIEFVENNLGDVNVELPFMIFDKLRLAN